MNRSIVVNDGSPTNLITASAVLRDDHAQLDRLVVTLSNMQHGSDESLHVNQQALGYLTVVSISAYAVTACHKEFLSCVLLDAVLWVLCTNCKVRKGYMYLSIDSVQLRDRDFSNSGTSPAVCV